MGVFRYKLKNGDGDMRHISVAAADEDEALATIDAQEQKKVAFVIGDPAEVAALEKKLKEGTLTGRDKGQLFSHQQDKPYKIVKGGEG